MTEQTTKIRADKDKIRFTVAPGVESLIPYPPGKPIEELERELGLSGTIKLASNENPIGPSQKALAALSGALHGLNRYPDGSSFYLKTELSERLGLDKDALFIGNGSNELIERLVRVFATGAGEVIYADPSFAVYPLVTQATGATGIAVALDTDMRIDLNAICDAITPKTRIIFIANPNNPTGTMVGASDFDAFIKAVPQDVIVCMDEAYCEYVTDIDNYPDTLSYVKEGYPVVGLRTFSKVYGLAGLRVGYGFGPVELIDYLNRVRQPFNVNSLAQVAALAALGDCAHVERSRRVNESGLSYLYASLDKLNLEYVPTQANFFLIKVGNGRGVYEALLKKGVIVRPMGGYGLDEYIRVSVGTEAENIRFIETLSVVLGAGFVA